MERGARTTAEEIPESRSSPASLRRRGTILVFMGFHILRVTHTARSFFSALPPRRRLHDVLFRFSRNGAPARFRSNPAGGFRRSATAFTVPFLSSPLLTHPFFRTSSLASLAAASRSRMHRGILTQRSDRSVLRCFCCLRTLRFSSHRRRPSRRFYFARGIRHTDVDVATSRAASIFPTNPE